MMGRRSLLNNRIDLGSPLRLGLRLGPSIRLGTEELGLSDLGSKN